MITLNQPDLFFKCECGCGYQLGVNILDDKTKYFEFNVRKSGRHKWQGTCIAGKDIKKLLKFINAVQSNNQ